VKWATRAGVHIDRAASAWLLRRFVDPEAEFLFVTDPDDVPDDATPFDMRGVTYGHQIGPAGIEECTFETILRRHDLLDPALWRVAAIIHEADIEDGTYDAPEAPGLDVILRGLSMNHDDDTVLAISGPVFDALYAYHHRALLLGRSTPA
jgi:hypothetical protein